MENETKKRKPYAFTSPRQYEVNEPYVEYTGPELVLDLTKRYTYADYLTWLDDKRRELIDGFIHFMSAPVRRHAHTLSELSFRLKLIIAKSKGNCRIYQAPFDVRLPPLDSTEDDKIYNVIQPDICVVCDLSKLDDRGCLGAPDLIIEILSPTTLKRDWNYKFNLYENAGVREYWIVDPKAKMATVFLLQPDGDYDMGTIYESNQKVPVAIFEGLEIDLSEVFED